MDNDDFTADTDVVVGERCSVFWPHTPLQLFICSATQDEDFHDHHEYECSRDQKSGHRRVCWPAKVERFLCRNFSLRFCLARPTPSFSAVRTGRKKSPKTFSNSAAKTLFCCKRPLISGPQRLSQIAEMPDVGKQTNKIILFSEVKNCSF